MPSDLSTSRIVSLASSLLPSVFVNLYTNAIVRTVQSFVIMVSQFTIGPYLPYINSCVLIFRLRYSCLSDPVVSTKIERRMDGMFTKKSKDTSFR
ncbi:hypothetical protein J2Z84_000946 [Agrobacterium rubi]|nr:hypothetical protein [Agrobacterium rubi]